MKRKLFSTLLCAFALLLLMGAGVEQDSAAAAIVIEEESASADGSAQVLETGIQTGIEAQDTEEISADEIYLGGDQFRRDPDLGHGRARCGPGPHPAGERPARPRGHGKDCGAGDQPMWRWPPWLRPWSPSVTITWDGGSSTAAVQSAVLDLTAKVGQQYLVANGRYLYVPEGVRMEAGRVVVPLKELVKAL